MVRSHLFRFFTFLVINMLIDVEGDNIGPININEKSSKVYNIGKMTNNENGSPKSQLSGDPSAAAKNAASQQQQPIGEAGQKPVTGVPPADNGAHAPTPHGEAQETSTKAEEKPKPPGSMDSDEEAPGKGKKGGKGGSTTPAGEAPGAAGGSTKKA